MEVSYTFAGVLLDFDGTIIDSTEAIVENWKRIGNELGIDHEEILRTSHGRRSIDVLQQLDPTKANWEYVSKMESQIPTLSKTSAVEIPGARNLLESLTKLHIPHAIVTSGTKALLNGWLNVLQLPHPQHVTVAEDVTLGKPDPEGYRKGKEKILASKENGDQGKEDVLVVEDAPAGIRAGKAADCKVLAVATTHSVEALKEAGADWVVKDLRVFITGATGYVGGQTAVTLIAAHPEYHVVALVRDQEQADKLKSRFPKISTVIGTLDDDAVLKEEAAKADVVLQTASSDHVPAVNSLLAGLASGTGRGRYIHISGTGVLNDMSTGPGNPTSKIYDDVKDIHEIINLPAEALHRNVDDAVITGGMRLNVPTAIICPPTIYGVGEGPIKKRSMQVPFLTEAILNRGKGFTVGKGENLWDYCHVSDVAKAFVVLTEEALKPNGGTATWGPEGYYFAEAGEFSWKGVSEKVTQIAHESGKLVTADIETLAVEDAIKFHPWAPVLWGGNCRSRASRLRALGWKPEGPSLWEAIPSIVEFEIRALGL
ncbi:2-deoxyglucose-6-phosphate phosphatase [Aspergillus neoniger CBS 115656]|uniref:2-deoxyglucose-6-phosphate phosphatase n=1 Tax=Aspergillus neoniger (strain CBS 115656) TaxID=1448310 RepID=A0A318ZSY7_ASPNB|nr:2-deoxyglucose-6-phosphate phosphatase [Aspergillus neoniger CBS 115656]PYH38802.1 2-deoxyglucose-6-phosphate phosphatase [Aspergillus neoniger CBS 115656]